MVDAFVGRSEELALLDQVLDEAVDGRGRCVAVTGEAGIGKARLCEVVASRALDRGMGVAWAACWDAGAPAFSRGHSSRRSSTDAPWAMM